MANKMKAWRKHGVFVVSGSESYTFRGRYARIAKARQPTLRPIPSALMQRLCIRAGILKAA